MKSPPVVEAALELVKATLSISRRPAAVALAGVVGLSLPAIADADDRGGGGIGARTFAFSTGSVAAVEGGPAVVIPGLETIVTVGQNSNLLVQADVRDHSTCPYNCCTTGDVQIQLNGDVVASRDVSGFTGGIFRALENYGLTWMSPPLPAGDHEVRLTMVADVDGEVDGETTTCLGSSAPDGIEARLVILELTPPAVEDDDDFPPGPGCGLGFELMFALLPLLWLHRRRRFNRL